jgi:hypothetical protein
MNAWQLALASTACWVSVAAAQGIDIHTPQLPPRDVGAQPSTLPQTGPAAQQSNPAAPGYGASAGTGQPQGYGQPGGPAYGAYGAAQPGYADRSSGVASALQQRRGTYGQPPGYGAGAQPAAPMTATPSAAGGNCRVQPSPDRQTVSLVGPDGLARRHVPLGEFRVQRVVHADDGAWAIVLTKLRGENQFAAMTFDLARCETANTVDLPATGEDVRFEGDAAVVRMAQGERRVPLKSGWLR